MLRVVIQSSTTLDALIQIQKFKRQAATETVPNKSEKYNERV